VLRYQAERLEQLVDDILDLSRLELGGRRVQFAPVDLNTIVENVVNIYKVQAANSGLHLSFSPGVQLPQISGERNQLAQVLTNLLPMRLITHQRGVLNCETFVGEKTAVCLQISDTGIGIAKRICRSFLIVSIAVIMGISMSPVPAWGWGLSRKLSIFTRERSMCRASRGWVRRSGSAFRRSGEHVCE
jgi:light-regulated signal transduction histidine kinase (bacteriophytochrome)